MNLFVISTLSCILEYIVPIFIKYITSHLYLRTKEDIELRNNLVNLKQEMIGMSVVDEFSKYAKLQRKRNKIEDVLKEKANERMSSKLKTELFAIYGFHIINGLIMLILLYLYSNKPVIVLPKDILWPLEGLLSWPCHQDDSISLMMWHIIARLVTSTFKHIAVK